MIVGKALGERERLGVHLLGAVPLAHEFEHLAKLEQYLDPRRLLHQRHQTLEVVDRRRVGIRHLGRIAGAAEVFALLWQIRAVPVVVRQQVEVALDRAGLGGLDVPAHALVQHRPEREGHALVGDLLRDDVLEKVRLLGLLVDVDEIARAEGLQVFLHLPEGPELGVHAGQHRRAKHATEDARHLERAPRRFAQLVDAAQDQAVQALRKFEPLQGRRVLRIDPMTLNEVEQFLDVERDCPVRVR